jgi:uncharacterized membrane protein
MAGLEQAFYIMGIVYMAIMFIIMVAILVVIIAIKAKVRALHDKVEERIGPVLDLIQAGRTAATAVKKVVTGNR